MTAPNIGQLDVQVRASFDRLARDLEIKLKAIAREQAIRLRVKLQEQTLGRLNKQLKSFTGLNSLQRSFQNASAHVTNFFDNIGPIARRLTLIGGAIGPVVTGLASLAPALVAVGTAAIGAMAALPGLLAAAGASIYVFKTAFDKLPGSVQASLDKFGVLKGIIQENFWAEATSGVNSFLKSALGPLKEGFGRIATSAGTFTSTLAGAFEKAFTPEVYEGFFDGIDEGFKILSDGGFADAFAGISAKLLEFGSSVIPIIAQGIENITVKFDKFLTANPDYLTNAFNTFVEIMKAVFSVIGSVVSIFKGLATAATDAGIGTASLTSPLSALAEAINSVNGQKAITSFLEQMKAGMDGLFVALGPLKDLLSNLAPILGAFVQTAGETLGPVFSKLFDSLNRPEVLQNISNLLQAFPKIFENIAPSIDLIVDKFSELADLASTTIDELSQTLNSAMQAILPAITPLIEPIKTLVGTIGDTLRSVFDKIGPVLQEIAPYFEKLIGHANSFMKALQSPAAQFIIDLILGFVKTAVAGFTLLVGGVMQFVDGLLSLFSGDFGAGFSKIFGGIGDLIHGAWNLFISFFAPAKILGFIGKIFPLLGRLFGSIPGLLGRGLAGLGSLGVKLGKWLLEAFLKLPGKLVSIGGNLIRGLISGVSAAIGGLLSWLTDHIIDPILEFFGIASPSSLFADIGTFLIEGLINGIKAIIGFLVDVFRVPLDAIMAIFSGVFNVIVTIVSGVWTVLSTAFNIWFNIIKGALSVIGAIFGAVWDGIKVAGEFIWNVLSTAFQIWYDLISAGINFIWGIITTVWDSIKAAGEAVWNGIVTAWTTFDAIVTAGIEWLSGIILGIWEAIKAAGAAVWDWIVGRWENFKANISAGIAVIRGIVEGVWNAIKAAGAAVWDFIKTRWENFKTNISNGINAIKGVVEGVWNSIKSVGQSIWTGITTAFNNFKSGIQTGIDAIGGFFSGLGDAIMAPFRSAFGFIAGLWNDTVGGLGFTIPDWVPVIGGNEFRIPEIPGYAQGVRNAMGGLAMVGERGPELINLPRGSDVYSASDTRGMLAEAVRNGGGGDTFAVSINVDVNDLAQMKVVGDFVNMLKNARVDARRTAGSGMVTV